MTTENQPIDLVSAALVECQGELKAAEFDATNPFFKSKYATLGSVIAASRQALSKAGLAILQIPTISEHLVSVHTKIVHKSGQILDCGAMTLSLGESDRNSDAQLAGSITTYLRRYAWSTVLGIYADSDTDGNDAPKGAVARQAAKPATSLPGTTQNAPQGQPGTAKATPIATPARRTWVINNLKAGADAQYRKAWTDFIESKKWIDHTQVIEDWPLDKVPVNGDQMLNLIQEFDNFCREARGDT